MNSCAHRPNFPIIIYVFIYCSRGYSFINYSFQKDPLFLNGVALLHKFHLNVEVSRLAAKGERD